MLWLINEEYCQKMTFISLSATFFCYSAVNLQKFISCHIDIPEQKKDFREGYISFFFLKIGIRSLTPTLGLNVSIGADLVNLSTEQIQIG